MKLHLEELVIERCSDFLSMGTLHFSPLASVSRLKVSFACSALPLTELAIVSFGKQEPKQLPGSAWQSFPVFAALMQHDQSFVRKCCSKRRLTMIVAW